MSLYEPVAVDLSEDERHLLRWGLIAWGGPTRCTEEMAIAMGFKSVADLLRDGYRIDIVAGKPLPEVDQARAVLAAEISFASDVMGSGLDWVDTVGMPDEVSIRTLRNLQRKVPHHRVFGTALGTEPDRPVS